MDGVLADFDKGWVERYNRDFGTNLHPKVNDHWDALVSVTHFEDDDAWWKWASGKHEDLFLGLTPLPGAIRGVRALKDAGHEVCIITAKPRWAAGHPSNWLIEHQVPYDEIHVTSKKTFVACDVYIDDALHNCTAFVRDTDSLVIQYSAWPYVNGGCKVPGAVHCTDWRQVVAAINDYDVRCQAVEHLVRHNTRRALQGVFT